MIIRGAGEAFTGFDGGDFMSAGKIAGFDEEIIFEAAPGEFVIPADTVKAFTTASITFTGTFTGSGCYFDPPAAPDENGWTPRPRYA